MEFLIGQVVISKAGRDKGDVFIIIGIDGDYLQLVNGGTRPLARPKKKKLRHIQPTNTVVAALRESILAQKYMKDADFTAALKKFKGAKEDFHG